MRNYYVFHPCVSLFYFSETISFIREILKNETDSYLVLEDPQNLMISKVAYKKYVRFYNTVVYLFKMTHLQNTNSTSQLCTLSAMSCFQYSIESIHKTRRICFVGLPFQQLRSICSIMEDKDPLDKMVFSVVFKNNERPTVINLRDGKTSLNYKSKPESIPCYYPLKESVSFISDSDIITHLENDQEKNTPHTNIYTCNYSDQKFIIKSTRSIDFDYIERNRALISYRPFLVKNGILEALPHCFIKDKINIVGVMFNYINGFSLECLINEDARYETMMTSYHMKPCLQNKIKILLSICSAAYEYQMLGIYFSDIKPDNFIITINGDVVPIDADGFSILNHTSSRPRPEYLYNNPPKGPYYQTHENEMHSLLVLMYLILIGTRPDDKRELCRIYHIANPDDSINYTPAAIELQKKWRSIPINLQRVLKRGIIDNESIDIVSLIREIIVAYKALTKISLSPKTEKFINSQPSIAKYPRIPSGVLFKRFHDLSGEIEIIRT